MKTTTPTPTNGKGKTIQCPNALECQVAQSAGDTLSLIDQRLERLERGLTELTGHLTRVSEESLERAKVYIDCNAKVLDRLKRIEVGRITEGDHA